MEVGGEFDADLPEHLLRRLQEKRLGVDEDSIVVEEDRVLRVGHGACGQGQVSTGRDRKRRQPSSFLRLSEAEFMQ